MKKILVSLSLILLSAAMVVGGTYAFFNDTETSRGNTFSAGSIDLKVDSEAHAGGLNCDGEHWVCDEWADEAVLELVNQGLKKNGGAVNANRSNPAVALGLPQSAGNDFESAVIGTFYSLGFGGTVVYRFENYIANEAGDDLKIYEITGGKASKPYPIEKAQVDVSQDSINWFAFPNEAIRDESFDLDDVFLPWVHYVRVTDTSDPEIHSNDADGYDLDAVEALHCSAPGIYLLGEECFGTWAEGEFDENIHKFFSFNDIKPGDYGEDTISLHVYDNDAWGQLRIETIEDIDNGCVEPEVEVDDDCDDVGDPGDNGELRASMNFHVWLDQGTTPGFQNGDKERFDSGYDYEEGDNIWQEEYEPLIITSGPIDEGGEVWTLSDALSLAYAEYCEGESEVGQNDYDLCHGIALDGRMVASNTYYFGIAWELPLETGNASQSDIFGGDMVLVVEQHRNNADPFSE